MKTRSLLFPVLAGTSLVAFAQNAPLAEKTSGSSIVQDFNIHTSSATEIVRLRTAGVDGSVIRSYIQTLQVPYKATAEDILYLHDHKVPDDLVVDWIKKGGELVGPVAQVQAQPQTAQHGAQSPDLVTAATPAPLPVQVQQQQPQVVYQNPAPTVVYSSPSYVYSDPYYYASPVSIGFSWGWGYPYYWGGYYHGGHYYGHGGHGGYYHGGGGYHGGGYHGGGHYNYASYRGGGSWGGHGGGGMHSGGGGGHGGGGRH